MSERKSPPAGTVATVGNLRMDDMLHHPEHEVPVRFVGRTGDYYLYHGYVADERTGKHRWHLQSTFQDELRARKVTHAGFQYDEMEWNPPAPPQETREMTYTDRWGKTKLIENGWLSPNGVMYPCEYHEHNDVEAAICKLYLPDTHDLQEAGWLKLSSGVADLRGDGWVTPWKNDRWKPTRQQRNYVEEHCIAGEYPLPYFLDESPPGQDHLVSPRRGAPPPKGDINYPKPRRYLDGD